MTTLSDNEAIGSPDGRCHTSPKAKVKRLGLQWQQEVDGQVKQQLLVRMHETLSFLDPTTRGQLIQQVCTT